MPNKSKIVGEVEVIVREMCQKGYNPTHIGKQVGLAKDTIKAWAIKNGFDLPHKLEAKLVDATPRIIEMLKQGIPRKTIQRELKVHFTAITRIAEEHGLSGQLRTRADASLDRILSREEVESRIPDESKYLSFDENTRKYVFLCTKTNKQFEKYVGKINQGSPYGKCGKSLTGEDYEEKLKAIGHTLKPGTFTKTKEPVVVFCPKGHERRLNRASYALSFNCDVCGNNGTSLIELEILEWVKQYYPNAYKKPLPNNITKHKTIDIFIPDLSLGIEYCGLYYHTENLEDKIEEGKEEEVGIHGKHYVKMLKANAIGMRLITIFGDEWEERGEQIRGFLVSAMKKNKYRIFARECEVREIDKKLGQEFLDKYHIQGAGKSSFYLGIFFKGDLAGVMSAGRHPQRHTTNDSTIYLNRLAFAYDLSVVGGASKLLNALIKYAKNNGFDKIASWSDNRWSDGGVYKALGFEYDSQSEKGRGIDDGSIWPEHWLVYRGKRITRYIADQMDLKNVELEKIYDCGKKRWVMNI